MTLTRLRDVPAEISAMRDFTGASMKGRVFGPRDGSSVDPERLSGIEREKFLRERAKIIYIVFSFATPIAWVFVEHDPYIAEQTFSMTTSTRHMPQVLRAWGSYLPEGHPLNRGPERHAVAQQLERAVTGHVQHRSIDRQPVRVDVSDEPASMSWVNQSRPEPHAEYFLDAIRRESAEREAALPLTDRIATLIGE